MKPVYINATAKFDDAADIRSLIPDANMRRRMSKILKMGVAAGMQCLQNVGIDSPCAIITATGLGCLADSEKFLRSVVESDEKTLPPTPFIQSTFNTIGSLLAVLTHCHGYNMTFVNRFDSFQNALLDAMLALADGCENVLVVAADEMTPTLHTILRRMNHPSLDDLCEGAAALVLSSSATDKTLAMIDNVRLHKRASGRVGTFPTMAALHFMDDVEHIGEKDKISVDSQSFSFDLRCYRG